jgi:hypothetical protein
MANGWAYALRSSLTLGRWNLPPGQPSNRQTEPTSSAQDEVIRPDQALSLDPDWRLDYMDTDRAAGPKRSKRHANKDLKQIHTAIVLTTNTTPPEAKGDT